VLIISSLCCLFDYMDRNVMGVLLQPVKIEFGLNDFEAGLLPTVLIIGVIVFVFPTAHLFDRWRVPFLYFAIPGVILAILALLMQDYKTLKTSPDNCPADIAVAGSS